MDTKKSNSGDTASGGKHGEKKAENILTKTVHSIRDKVHGFADERKEKTHNKKHGAESKTSKNTTDPKKTAISAKVTAATESEDNDSDSDTDQKLKPSPSGSSSNSTRIRHEGTFERCISLFSSDEQRQAGSAREKRYGQLQATGLVSQ